MRLRTTAAAVLVVAIALVVGAVSLVLIVRGTLHDGVESTAEERASTLVDEVETSGLPGPGSREADEDDDADDLEDVLWQVTDASGAVVRSSQPLSEPLPSEDAGSVQLPGAEDPFVVVTEDVRVDGEEHSVVVAASLEDVEESTSALVAPLLIGLPLLFLLVGGTTWMVAGRALAPVESIRREVEQITGDRLERRVPEPPSRDEIHRLSRTMNQMLGRLQDSRLRQQQFVADASHELRSPLTSIRQTAEVTRAHPEALPEGELAEAVLEETARMQRLVEQLLLLTRADEGAVLRSHHDVDLDDLVLAEARRARRAVVTVDTSGVAPGRLRGDRAALGQVVRNLVDNAARHAASTVTVSVRETDGEVELVVEDDGAGIPEEDRRQVFERFVRLDEARARDAGGSGLGLAIVEEIVAAHGGRVEVSSSSRGGARFVVLLPSPGHEGG